MLLEGTLSRTATAALETYAHWIDGMMDESKVQLLVRSRLSTRLLALCHTINVLLVCRCQTSGEAGQALVGLK